MGIRTRFFRLFIVLSSALLLAALLLGLPLLPGPPAPLLPLPALAQSPTTAFTYQGRLRSGDNFVNATCSFQFSLYDAASGGTKLGPSLAKTSVVSAGYFMVSLDFGNVFSGTVRYLEVRQVNCGLPGDPVDLAGRVAIRPVPQASYSLTAGVATQIDWSSVISKPAGFADNADNGLIISCANKQTLRWSGAGWACTNISSDHGGLTGLDAAESHLQYLMVNGTRPMAADLDLDLHQVISAAAAAANGQAVIFEQAVLWGGAAGGDLGTQYPAPKVIAIRGRPITDTLPATDQVLTWNGTSWGPADPQAGGSAGGGSAGDLSGTYPNPAVVGLQGNPITTTAPLDRQVLKWNGSYWVPAGAINTGDTAGGDLAGTYPDPSVVGLRGRPVASTAPNDKQFLTWNGLAVPAGRWEPADPQTTGPAGGDLTGTYPNPTVARIQGQPVLAGTTPGNKQILTWNGTNWLPGNVTTLQGRAVASTAPAANQVLLWNGSQWLPSAITTLQGRTVASTAPATNQALLWNGSQWLPGAVLYPGYTLVGGDLSGTYPSPQLNANTIEMAELAVPMGSGAGTSPFSSNDAITEIYVMPSATSFVPAASGKCLVTTSAYIKTISSGSATGDPPPFLRTAKKVGAGAATNDGGEAIYFAPDDATDYRPVGASAGFVWDINPSDVGQAVLFGCYVTDPPGSWDSDETVYCRVSYLCE